MIKIRTFFTHLQSLYGLIEILTFLSFNIFQIIARYNFERLCNNLPRTTPLVDLRAPIPEGYFPKLDSLIASRSWPGNKFNFIF